MERKLIINADDFGMCHSYNQAVFDLLEEERISTSTLMPVAPGRDEAAEWCLRRNAKNIGLHTTFTSEWSAWRWKSLTGLPSLHDEDGFMPRGVAGFLGRVQEAEAALELEAQFEWFEGTGLFLSHADNHMGSVYPTHRLNPASERYPDFLPVVFDACRRHGGVPFRMFRRNYWNEGQMIPACMIAADIEYGEKLNIDMVDNLYSYPFSSPEGETYENFRREVCEVITGMPEGVHEIYFHPSIDTDEVRRICHSWQRRVWEYRLLMDDELHYVLKDAGIHLISYRKMQEMRRRV